MRRTLEAGVTQFPNPGIRGLHWRQRHLWARRRVDRQQQHGAVGWRQPGEGLGDECEDGAIKKLVRMNGQANPILVKTTGTPPVNTSTTRADELCYDPKDNIIMIASPAEPASNGGPFVTFISSKTYKVLGHLTLDQGTGIEQCGWSPKTGKFYQNVPADPGGQDQVAVIDPKTMKVDAFHQDRRLQRRAGPGHRPRQSDPDRLHCPVVRWSPEQRSHRSRAGRS